MELVRCTYLGNAVAAVPVLVQSLCWWLAFSNPLPDTLAAPARLQLLVPQDNLATVSAALLELESALMLKSAAGMVVAGVLIMGTLAQLRTGGRGECLAYAFVNALTRVVYLVYLFAIVFPTVALEASMYRYFRANHWTIILELLLLAHSAALIRLLSDPAVKHLLASERSPVAMDGTEEDAEPLHRSD